MNTRDIKQRQRAITNTRQVTRAMEMVSAVKMRKAQERALISRPYALRAMEILSRLSAQKKDEEEADHIFLCPRAGGKIIVVPVTSDKGLIGAFNANVLREASLILDEYKRQGRQAELVVLGERSRAHYEGRAPVNAHFKGLGDYADSLQTSPISRYLQTRYANEDIGEIILVYTEFISTLKQRVTHRRFLPITYGILHDIIQDIIPERGKYADMQEREKKEDEVQIDYLFEPTPQQLLGTLLPMLLDAYFYHVVLESNASEHSARMVAMKNASDNAKDILQQLTLKYNKARQSGITAEVNEIVAGAEALR